MASIFKNFLFFFRQLSSPKRRQHAQQGFSLIELSIALSIIGIVVAGGLSLSTSVVDRQAYIETNNQMDEIERALAAFVSVNGRLPCPADPVLSVDNGTFGTEVIGCDGTSGNMGSTNAIIEIGGDPGVIIGALPVRTLGLRDRFAADDYGFRYTYAVTENYTTDTDFADSTINGEVQIVDGGGSSITSQAAYIVVSHGGSGEGGRRYETATISTACGSTTEDSENCNTDGTFVDTRFNRGTIVANFFDDAVRWRRRELIDTSGGGSASLWTDGGANTYLTESTDAVGIGTTAPDGNLEIQADPAPGVGVLANMLILDSNNRGVGAGAAIQFKGLDTPGVGPGYLASIEATSNASSDGLLTFRISNDGTTTATSTATGASSIMQMNNLAEVGINTAPVTDIQLGVLGSGNNNSVGISATANGANSSAFYAVSNGSNSNFVSDTDADTVTHFRVSDTDGTNARGMQMSFAAGSDNSIGLEIDSVASTNTDGIDISTTGTNSEGVIISTSGTNSEGVLITTTNTLAAGIEILTTGATSEGIAVDTQNTSSPGITISTSGNSSNGIAVDVDGTGSVAGKFEYSGGNGCDIGTSTRSLDCTGNAHVDGNITATGSITPSDARLKKDVQPLDITAGLQSIKALKPVSYEWKDKKRAGKRDIGFIAQEVEKVLPGLVHQAQMEVDGKTDNYKLLEYNKLVVPLVLALQQLSDENDQLKARLDALEKKLEE